MGKGPSQLVCKQWFNCGGRLAFQYLSTVQAVRLTVPAARIFYARALSQLINKRKELIQREFGQSLLQHGSHQHSTGPTNENKRLGVVAPAWNPRTAWAAQ